MGMDESARPAPLPRSTAVFGLALFACAWLPLTPGGRTFFNVVVETFGEGVMAGVVMLLGFGSPFLFGLAVAVGRQLDHDAAASLVRSPVTMMHSQLLLVSWMIMRHGDAVASVALFLFAVVGGLHVVRHSATTRAAGRPASFAWYVRWGGIVIAAVCGWLWIQRAGGFCMGLAVPVAGLCAVGLVLRAR